MVAVPGKPDESLLLQLVHDGEMPPDGEPLSDAQITELEAAMPFTLVLDDAWKREQN